MCKITDAELTYECGQTTYLCGVCGKSNRIGEQCPCFEAEKKIQSAVIALGEAKYANCKGTTQHWLAIGTKLALEAGDILRKSK